MDSHSRLVIIPAAGRSQRFRDVGIATPKPLIRFNWLHRGTATMLEHVLDDELGTSSRVVVVCRTDDRRAFVETLPNSWNIVDVASTGGQSDSVLVGLMYAKRCWGLADGVAVLNADAGFRYPLEVFYSQAQPFGAAALVFHGHGNTAYSYVDRYPLFTQAAEKTVLGPWALAGAYYFRHADQLYDALENQLKGGCRHAGENYLSAVFNMPPLSRERKLAVAMPRERLHVWGTPEDLARDGTVDIVGPHIRTTLEAYQ